MCGDSIPSRDLIESIGFVGGRIPCYIYRKESDSLVGNNNRNRSRKELDEPVDLNLNLIRYRAYKRIVDILISYMLLLTGLTTIPSFIASQSKKTYMGSRCALGYKDMGRIS